MPRYGERLSRWIFLGLLVLTGLCLTRTAGADDTVDCGEVSVRFATAGDETYCMKGESKGRSGGGNPIGWGTAWELMGIDNSDRSLVVQVVIANRFSYLERADVRRDVELNEWFITTEKWGEPSRVARYDVIRFEGFWQGIVSPWKGVGFARYERPIDRGYRERLNGVYCVSTGRAFGRGSRDVPAEHQLLNTVLGAGWRRAEPGGCPRARPPRGGSGI